jgi:hypothetical protein
LADSVTITPDNSSSGTKYANTSGHTASFTITFNGDVGARSGHRQRGRWRLGELHERACACGRRFHTWPGLGPIDDERLTVEPGDQGQLSGQIGVGCPDHDDLLGALDADHRECRLMGRQFFAKPLQHGQILAISASSTAEPRQRRQI